MYIDKAIKKQSKNKRLFFITMVFLGLFLPITVYLADIKSAFIMWYLAVIEVLILFAIIIKINFYKLDFYCSNNKLKFKSGLFSKESLLICDKVGIVHTNKSKEEMEIVVITTVKFKNKWLKPITKTFLQKHPEAGHEYLRLKRINPDTVFYFQIIKRGALDKYILLDTIYKNCVKAVYTASAIENIKVSRNQKEI